MEALQRDLLGADGELVETHISWVFLRGDEVIKVKKPVDLGFLDFSTLARRRAACEAEIAVNRRLAPVVYLGVVPITRDAAGRHRVGGEGEAVEWAVRMRRLPAELRADHLLAAGRLTTAHLEAVAHRLADFHATCRSDEETARFGTPAAIAVNVRENFAQTAASITEMIEPAEADEIEGWQIGFLERHADTFRRRLAEGRVRDGHGDLRLEHVYFAAGELPAPAAVTILDAIEFNQRFRFADVASDVAFLSMDLAAHGRVDLAESFLAAYARAAQDYGLYRLIDFYESYRAFVRAKVASYLAAQGGLSPAAEASRAEARRHYLLALAADRRSLLAPAVVAVGGWIAAGKSTIAAAVAAAMSAPVVDADRTRKHLVGVDAETPLRHPAWQGAYQPTATQAVYEEIFERARAVLASGRPVILDASFRARAHREATRQLARRHGAAFTFIECRAPRAVLLARLAAREQASGVSDGRREIFDEFVTRWEPVDELPAAEHVVLDSTRAVAECLALLRRRLPTWPSGL